MRVPLLFTLALVLLASAFVIAPVQATVTGPKPPGNEEYLDAAVEYLELRAHAALEGGDPTALRRVFATRQGIVEEYLADGHRRFHEAMGDFPQSSELEVVDAAVRSRRGSRATVVVTMQTMTEFSPESQRSCSDGDVMKHVIDLTLRPDGGYSIFSDTYPADGTTAYLKAVGAPADLIAKALASEQREMDASAAAQKALASDPVATAPSEPAASGDPDPVGSSDVHEYDRADVVAYAKKWWNSRNDYYNDYSDSGGDCANFVSQCTFAGGMGKFGDSSDPENQQWWFRHSNYTDSKSWRYCPTQVDAWRWQHANLTPARYVVKVSTSKPDGFSKGDVAWTTDSGSEKHALICTGFSGKTPLFSCHSANQWNKPISHWGGEHKFGIIADRWRVD